MSKKGTYFLGIDPGVTGAVACAQLTDDSLKWQVIDSPKSFYKDSKGRDQTDSHPNEMANIIIDLLEQDIPRDRLYAIIEKMWIHPDMAAPAMTKLMRNASLWEGILYALIPPRNIKIVAAVTWKSYYNLIEKGKRLTTRERKKESIELASSLFEACAELLEPKTHVQDIYQCGNRAEALLIANYAMCIDWNPVRR